MQHNARLAVSSLVQVIASRRFGDKLLPEPMIIGTSGRSVSEISLILIQKYDSKGILKWRPNGGHFIQTSMNHLIYLVQFQRLRYHEQDLQFGNFTYYLLIACKAIKQTVELPVMWGTMVLIWHYCNVTTEATKWQQGSKQYTSSAHMSSGKMPSFPVSKWPTIRGRATNLEHYGVT